MFRENKVSGHTSGGAHDAAQIACCKRSAQAGRDTHARTRAHTRNARCTLGWLSSIPVLESQAKAESVESEVLQNWGRESKQQLKE
eukprot:1152292-Pelagomonas_calceolata.AAC.8